MYISLSSKVGGLSFMTYLPFGSSPWTRGQHSITYQLPGYRAVTFFCNPGVLLQKILNSFKSGSLKRSLELLHMRQVHQCPDISLTATAGTMSSVRKRYCHRRKVAGLKFLSLPLQNRSLKEPLCNYRGTEHPSNRWDMSVRLFPGDESLALWPTHFPFK